MRLFTHLALASAAAAALATAGLCAPVVIAAFFGHVPPRAMMPDIMMTVLAGIGPTALYLALPLTVGVGVTLRFSQFATDGYLAVLHASKLSALQIAAAPLTVAALAAGLGLWLSSQVAPRTVSGVHDMIHTIAHNLDHRLLPTHRMVTLSQGRYSIYLGDDLGGGRYRDVMVSEKMEGGMERTLTARLGIFDETDGRRMITLVGGVLLERPEANAELRMVSFAQMAQPLGAGGSSEREHRNWRGDFERPGLDFLSLASAALADPAANRAWWSEATKRFGLPLMALGHTLLGLGLVLSSIGSAMRDRSLGYLFAATVLVVHVVVLVVGESLVRQDPRFVVLAAAAILAEIVVGLGLILKADAPRGGRFRGSWTGRVAIRRSLV